MDQAMTTHPNQLSHEELQKKVERLCAALEYYANAEKVLVTHKPKNNSGINVKISRPDNGEIARAALDFDPTKEIYT
jgi:hypothetical protein